MMPLLIAEAVRTPEAGSGDWIILLGTIVAAVMVLIGLFFILVATVGFIRLPDLFSRMHVTSIIDSVGAPMILLGVAIYLTCHALSALIEGNFVPGDWLAGGKLVLAIAFLLFTSPLVGHFLSRAALEMGYAADVVRGMDLAKQAADGSVTSDPDEDLGHSELEIQELTEAEVLEKQKEAAEKEDESA